jgi:uncharacterized NAD-dependent epimerase/dehydratase family protein
MILGLEGTFHVPPISEVIKAVLEAARVTNPACRCVGVSVNTSRMSQQERVDYLGELERESGFHCTDPVAMGVETIADRLLEIQK